ncbi:unnamed protein product [Bemisia tabaci]|uniref:General transcription factor IIH subunit 3 n=1 Tax=Bemisia tabaci TaxID=7038 RepID=A0A9P0A3I7_BEMTA|nr:unnamed protein product [Bemisia tabaci]
MAIMEQQSKLEVEDVSLLVVVIDLSTEQPFLQDDKLSLTHYLNAIITFINSHLMLKACNRVAVIGSDYCRNKYLYPDEKNKLNIRQTDSQYEMFTLVEQTIRNNVKSFFNDDSSKDDEDEPSKLPSLISGAAALGLCFINRIEATFMSKDNLNSRILIITGSLDFSHQYMSLMNVFFAAQRQNIAIDVCSLEAELKLLQQGTDITNGHFLLVPSANLSGLVQYLLWVFLPEPPLRKHLIVPPPVKVDYRASCFCHKQLIELGYVCSVCLSVFCKFTPICMTCHAVFKSHILLPKKIKKRKVNSGSPMSVSGSMRSK